MASEQDWTGGSALIVPDRRLTLWTAQSTLTQAGNRAGVPAGQNKSPAHLKASGTQEASSLLNVRTQSGGDVYDQATKVWRRDDTNRWRGWDAPSVITHSEWLTSGNGTYTDGSGDLKWVRNPCVDTTADHKVILCYDEQDDGFSGAEFRIVCQVRGTNGTWGSKVAILSQDTASLEFHPCPVVLPSGRILVYYFVYDNTDAYIRAVYSDDDGATWATAEPFAIAAPISTASFTLHRMRAAVDGGGNVSLWVWVDNGTNDTLVQYAARSGGSKLKLIQTGFNGGGTQAAAVDVVWTGAKFLVLYIDSSGDPQCVPYGNAFAVAASGDAVSVSASTVAWSTTGSPQTKAELACVVDDGGTIYAFGMHPGADAEGEVVRSIDGGTTWEALGQSGYSANWGSWFSMEDSASHPSSIVATRCQGRVLMACGHTANPGNEDDSVGVLYLAGYATVTKPAYGRLPDERTRACWERTWLPFDLPSDTPVWTKSGAGVPALAAPGAVAFGSMANTWYYDVPSGTVAEGLVVCFAMKLTTGGSAVADDVSVLLRVEDGTESYDAVLRFSGTGIQVYDNHAAANVGSEITAIDPNDGVAVLAAVDDGKVSVWVRSLSNGYDRDWIEGVVNQSLNDGGAATAHRIEWGHRSGTSAASEWYWFFHSYDEWVGSTGADHLATGQDNPEQIMGRRYAGGAGAYVADGVSIAMDDGPTVRGDEWDVATRYDYGADRLTSEEWASPRQPWRSTTKAWDSSPTSEVLAWYWSANAANTYPSDVLAIQILDHNVPKITVELHNGSSWSYSQTITLGYSVAYTRLDDEVHPAASGTDTPFFNRDEMAGGTFVMTDATTTVARRVDTNPQGRWTSATTRQTMAKLIGVDGTEGNTNTAGLFVPRNALILIPLRGTPYKGVRITCVAPSAASDPRPAEAYFEIGTLLIGELVPNAEPYSWGRFIEREAGKVLVEQSDRTRRGYLRSRKRRQVTYGYVDGTDLKNLLGEEADPDFIEVDAHASAVPIGVVGGSLLNHEGIFTETDGPGDIIGYVAHMDEIGSGVSYVLELQRDAFMCGRVTSGPFRVDVIVGDEMSSEWVRGDEFIISEEV